MPSTMKELAFFIFVVLLCLHQLAASSVENHGEVRIGPVIKLRSGAIDVSTLPARQPRRRALEGAFRHDHPSWGVLAERQQWLVTVRADLDGAAGKKIVDAIETTGGHVGGYFPHHTLLVLGNEGVAATIQAMKDVVWVGPFEPRNKLDPDWNLLLDLLEQKGADSIETSLMNNLPISNSTTAQQRMLKGLAFSLKNSTLRVPILVSFPMTTVFHSGSSTELAEPSTAAVADWGQELAEKFDAILNEQGPRRVVVHTHLKHLQAVLGWLSEHPSVHWLSPQYGVALHNYEAAAIIQSGMGVNDQPVTDAATHPIWAAGLTGAGQVVGCGDSGIDLNHCFFTDPAVDLSATSSAWSISPQIGIPVYNDTLHRKIRLYFAIADRSDSIGHGTHVVGSVLGKPVGGPDALKYQGMAPDAKIAFIDIGNGASDTITPPVDLAQNYFPVAYSVGARIHSDSWGSASISYDAMSADVDLFTWNNKDFLPVFAAGNDGKLGGIDGRESGERTVTSPATAKNCITVGATESIRSSAPTSSSSYIVYDMSIDMAGSHVETVRVVQGKDFGDASTLKGTYPLTLSDPVDACNPINNAEQVAGSVVLIQRGSCTFTSKVQYAEQAGAAAALIYDNEMGAYFQFGSDGFGRPSLPAVGVTRRIGLALNAPLKGGLPLMASFSDAVIPAEAYEHLATYSSQGPTIDGRIKPDIVAPGTTISSHPGETSCYTAMMEGTSMATPVVAGAAVLARQYFVDGWYPAGKAGKGTPMVPSGALLKAVLLGGAQALMGYEKDTGLPIDLPPSFRQGFGRVHLSRSLYLDGDKDWNLQVVDSAEIQKGEAHRYCLTATGKGDVVITLVWFDFPAMPSSSAAIVNDLDLAVRAAGYNGTLLMGNGGGFVMDGGDRTNTVEQVVLQKVPAGDISIEVQGIELSPHSGPQPYALVAVGAFTGSLQSDKNPAWDGKPVQCAVGAVVIKAGPSGLTNEKTIKFEFVTSDGGDSNFQCQLTPRQATEGTWESCSSPKEYKDLPDGDYVFSVKNGASSVAIQHMFVKDTSPPVVDLNNTVTATTANASVVLDFRASDRTAVSFQCKLAVEDKASMQGVVYNRSSHVFPLDEWVECISPQLFHWLMPGHWTFSLSAQDAAGNNITTPAQEKWTVQLEPGIPYARITDGPFGVTKSGVVEFKFITLQADAAGALAEQPDPMQCAMDSLPATSTIISVDPSSLPSAFAPCTSPFKSELLKDGTYLFVARPAGVRRRSLLATLNDQLGYSVFTVDTTAPNVTIVSKPKEHTSSRTVQFTFSVSEEAAAFQCMLSNGTDGETLQACDSPVQYDNLPDGEYTFSVTATDTVGNMGALLNSSFWVDATAPIINVQPPQPTKSDSISISWTVDDGTGSGVTETECRLEPVAMKEDVNPEGSDWQNCTSPMEYQGLQEGLWGFSIRAKDAAGQQTSSTLHMVAVDTTAPNTTITSGPLSRTPVPSTVTFKFVVTDGSYGSNISYSECFLASLTDSQYQQLLDNGTDDNGNVKIAAFEASGSWTQCTDGMLTYTGLKTGKYGFQVRAVDGANNTGPPTPVWPFQVDASMPLPVTENGQSTSAGLDWVWIVVIAGASAVAGFLLVAILIGCIKRCVRRKQHHHGRYENAAGPHGYAGGPVPPPHAHVVNDPELQAAIQASLVEQQAVVAQSRNASGPLRHVPHSSTSGIHHATVGPDPADPHLLAAIQASLQDVQPTRVQGPEESDEYRLAVQASLEEQYRSTRRQYEMLNAVAATDGGLPMSGQGGLYPLVPGYPALSGAPGTQQPGGALLYPDPSRLFAASNEDMGGAVGQQGYGLDSRQYPGHSSQHGQG